MGYGFFRTFIGLLFRSRFVHVPSPLDKIVNLVYSFYFVLLFHREVIPTVFRPKRCFWYGNNTKKKKKNLSNISSRRRITQNIQKTLVLVGPIIKFQDENYFTPLIESMKINEFDDDART